MINTFIPFSAASRPPTETIVDLLRPSRTRASREKLQAIARERSVAPVTRPFACTVPRPKRGLADLAAALLRYKSNITVLSSSHSPYDTKRTRVILVPAQVLSPVLKNYLSLASSTNRPTMLMQIPPPTAPQRSTVEYFAYRESFDYTHSNGGSSPALSTDSPLPPIVDPIARLTRECSALRLRLATAERVVKDRSPSGLSTQAPLSEAGTRAPPSSARTPPTLGFPLDITSNPSTEYHSTLSTTTVTYARSTRTQVNLQQPPQQPQTQQPPPQQQQQPQQPPPAKSRQDNRQQQGHPHPKQNTGKRPQSHSRSPRRRADRTLQNQQPQAQAQQQHSPGQQQQQSHHGQQHPNRRKVPPPQQQQQQQERRVAPGSESPRHHHQHSYMKLNERCKQLERSLRDVQELLRARDREIEVLKKERDRLLTERDHDRKLEKEREQLRDRERALEKERERTREREREREKQRERERERERERDRERERERERERDKERERERERDRERERERERTLSYASSERSFRRSRSQAPSSVTAVSTAYSSMSIDSEHLAHLRSLDVFLTKTDGWSGAQVIQAVEDLNAEITHFAASATEVCVFERRAPVTSAGRSRSRSSAGATMSVNDAMELAPWLGPGLAKILSTHDHTQDPFLVQLALQASVATCCARSLSLFCVGFPSKLDGLLSRVFAHLQVAGKHTPVDLCFESDV